MRRANLFGRSVPLLFHSTIISLTGVILTLAAFRYAQAAQINVGGGCGLVDAITAANTDSGVGTCTAGSGADTVILSNTTYVLTTSNNISGGPNGLPVIGTSVTISGSGDGNGSIIQRNLSLSCPAPLITQTFRFLVVNDSGDLTVKGVTLQNGCHEGGGAIASTGKLTVIQSNFLSNTGFYGGGIYSMGPLTVTQSSFIANSSSSGGGIYLYKGRVEQSFFSKNRANNEGGAVFIQGTEEAYLLANRIFENTAGDGGALYVSAGNGRIDNNLFVKNDSDGAGFPADIALGAGPSTLTGHHNTMVAGFNEFATAIVAGEDGTGDQVAVTDTIISGYASGLVTRDEGARIVANGVLWANTTVPTDTSGGLISVTNDISGSAAFANPAADDYHLTLASLAVNNGVSNVPATDTDGDLRPTGAASDLGYDEFVAAVGVAITKTVGLDANTCAGTDALTVDENTAVYYCFTVQNTGELTFTHHTLIDALLGISTTLDIELGPAETMQITRSQISALGPFTVTESVTNTVLVTSTNVESPEDTSGQSVAQFAATASDSSVAFITAEPVEEPIDKRLYLPALHRT